MNPDKIKKLEEDGWKVGSADEVLKDQSCPSCDCGGVSTTWIEHTVEYEDVTLKCNVPMRTCLHCGAEWLDHSAESIIDRMIARQ